MTTEETLFIAAAQRTIAKEIEAVQLLSEKINGSFVQACQLMKTCGGRVIVLGMGKSGHIGHKIAATLSSTGTPAFFVHPAEASHGDMGMITTSDVVMAISNSGNAVEILTLLPIFKRMKIPIIAITGQPNSALALAADVNIDIGKVEEACPMNLAPTSSTTVTLVLGDALAIALLESRGFTKEEFAFSHPGGVLGRRLLLRTSDIMHSGDKMPMVKSNVTVMDALTEITAKGFGITAVLSVNNTLAGVFTDGDLRRAIDQGVDVKGLPIQSVMSKTPSTITEDTLAAEALTLMESKKITCLIVINQAQIPVGIVHMHDMLRAGLA